MTHPYKTREGGATVTIFVPYDCRNHCPFCVNKQEYAHAEGFSVEAILKSIAVMDEITPRCDFVFTGGEPFANLKALQRMLDAIPTTHKVYINTTFPVQPGCSAEEMIAFTERNRDKITCINVSRHLQRYVEESPDEVVAAEQDLAGGRAHEPVDAADQRALARPRGADDRGEPGRRDDEADAAQHRLARPVFLDEIADHERLRGGRAGVEGRGRAHGFLAPSAFFFAASASRASSFW